ncbi:hypothetical protein [Dermacoccus nishinomiyaensis]|uniref:hypothetical protein n=1 Tax=Dermacoccus nishinomiyaensis TaxID=1274 RepID=UPI001F51228E|nr:hypothetical protein [Dermacoccus nishinomiyaensis]MCI0153076.1 hypothetical protein [Dermacoccus nishinomiyaensis]
MKMRVLKDGEELTSQTGDVGKPGSDGEVALSGDIGVAPAARPPASTRASSPSMAPSR